MRGPSVPEAPSGFEQTEQRLHRVSANARLVRELTGMAGLDQELRNTLVSARANAEPAAQERYTALSQRYLGPSDRRNAARLSRLLRGRGWFRRSEVGDRGASAAFLIVQHSGDIGLMRRVLALMQPLLSIDEVEGQDYALLYDRVALHDGRSQRYGTQGFCGADGRYAVPPDLEDPEHLEDRRSAVGMTSMATYLEGMNRLYGRCTPRPSAVTLPR